MELLRAKTFSTDHMRALAHYAHFTPAFDKHPSAVPTIHLFQRRSKHEVRPRKRKEI